MAADGQDSFVLTLPHSGRLFFSQNGFEQELAEDQTRFVRSNEPYMCGSRDTLQATSILIPANLLRARVTKIDDRCATILSPDLAAFRLFRDYAALIEQNLDNADESLEGLMADHLIDLAALLLAPSSDAKERVRQGSLKGLRREVVQKYIADRSADPRLNLTNTAVNLGLSPRYVQLLLEEAGTSFSSQLREMRIARASSMLLDKRYDHLGIADIAFESGFSDVSSFNRTFRQRIGDTPGAIRAARRKD
jgi:AraC-like DNA-binding protein